MPQLWLPNRIAKRDGHTDLVLPLDRKVREELLTLMAMAIETLHRHRAQGGINDERFSAFNQDHGTAPGAQGDRLPQAVVTQAGCGKPGESTPTVHDGGAG